MSYQRTGTPRESVPQNDQGNGKTNVRHCECEFVVSAGWLNRFLRRTTSLAEDNYCPEGCQRIHRKAGEVCDIFIPDFCEEGIERPSQINTWSVK